MLSDYDISREFSCPHARVSVTVSEERREDIYGQNIDRSPPPATVRVTFVLTQCDPAFVDRLLVFMSAHEEREAVSPPERPKAKALPAGPVIVDAIFEDE